MKNYVTSCINKFSGIVFFALCFSISTNSYANKSGEVIYLENDYKGEKNYLYFKHNKMPVTTKEGKSGIEIYNDFIELKKDHYCYNVIKEQSSTKYSLYENTSVSLLFKIDSESREKECKADKNNQIRERHYIKVSKELYDKVPCCGKYNSKSNNEYFKVY